MRSVSLGLFLFSLILVACHSEDPKLVGTPPEQQRKAQGDDVQTLNSKVDILFVIDDSGSMDWHQKNLSTNIDLFLSGLAQNKFIDYHIGVISTAEEPVNVNGGAGPGAGRLAGNIRYVDRNTPNGLDILKNNMLLGTWGSATEKMFAPTYLALTQPNLSGWNQGFYRPDAFLATVFLTDAEDQSDESEYSYPKSPTDPTNLDPQAFYSFLVNLKNNDARRVLTYGVYIPSNVPSSICSWDDPNMPHVRLDKFFQISKGVTYSLCDVDYGKKLAGIGADLARRVGRTVWLDRRPNPYTIQVLYGTQVIPAGQDDGWTYDPAQVAIVFGPNVIWSNQPAGTAIEVYFDPAP